MTVVGVCSSQLSILLEMLDDQASTVKGLIQKWEFIHQEELGFDKKMSIAEIAMKVLTR